MNFEELTIRGRELGVNSINYEDDKGYDELGNWDNYECWILMINSRDYMLYLSKNDHSWSKNLGYKEPRNNLWFTG